MTVVAEDPSPADGDTDAPSRPPFRGDVDGLRALAIVLVVAFHVGVPGFAGGFVGVDVFFVISGYLITRNLLHEGHATGGVALLEFWARRIRRLVPAMALVVVATLVASLLVLPAVEVADVVREGRAASLYVSNLLFAVDLSDYFDGQVADSPFLHTWSLGVEEQFYVLWPLLVGLGVLVAARRRGRLRAAATALFGITLAASLVISLRLTDDGSPWAFYGLQSRAWEFAVAGLLAVAAPAVAAHPLAARRGPRTALAVAGLAAVAAATLLLDEATAYPGTWALLPVLGTAAVIVAGEAVADGRGPVGRLLAVRPAQWLGRVSYSWYLWHWPAIVLVAVAVGPSRLVAGAAALVSLAVAAVVHVRVEQPLRFAPWLTRSQGRTYLVGAALTAGSLLVGLAVVGLAEARMGPFDRMVRDAQADVRQVTCPEEARSASGVEHCLGGDPSGEVTVLLVGDSHARHWTGALHEAAGDAGLRSAHRWRGNCPALDVRVRTPIMSRSDVAGCTAFLEQTDRLVADLDPDVIVVSNAAAYTEAVVDGDGVVGDPERAGAVWAEGLREQLARWQREGRTVGLVEDNPVAGFDVPTCVAREGDLEACAVSAADARSRTGPIDDANRRVARALGVPTFSVRDELCDDERCAIAVDGALVYADAGHLTRAFTGTQEGRLAEYLAALARSAMQSREGSG